MSESLSIVNKLATPLALLFNTFVLVQLHGASALNVGADSNQSIVSSFLNRMKENGVENMETMDMVFCGCAAMMGMEALNMFTKKLGKIMNLKYIPVRGKHLDDLESIDLLYITLNKIATVPFVYLLAKYMYNEPNAVWSLKEMTVSNTLMTVPPFFIIYDFFYTILHWALHIQSVYGYIHKHHHRQKAPSRANVDAVNVHPIEFFLGEYNHLLAIFLWCNVFGMKMHVMTLTVIFTMSAVLTGLNHTRFDSKIQLLGITLYDSKWHDVHHRIPQSNYGQYTNFWDLVFRSFRAYNPDDRVNPDNQLGPNGKSLSYNKRVKAE